MSLHILITGGAGFLGVRLARTLLARGELSLRGQAPRPITRLVLADRMAPPADLAADPRVQALQGDLLDMAQQGQLPLAGTELVYHLAAAVSAECEADFDLGMRSNLDTTRALLEACRATGQRPTFVLASSLAVFGALPGQALPVPVGDDTLPTPQGSYGIQKFICEQLVADYSRKGFIAGRPVRLMTVSVRPGRPNGAASGFLSGMVREPLAGLPARCPVAPETAVALSSPHRTVEGLVRAAEADDAAWGPPVALNLPALSTTARDMAAALERAAGPEAAALIDWTVDPQVQRLIQSWPGSVASPRAHALGLRADPDFDTILRAYMQDHPDALRLPRP